jgi:hypothetical protein
MSDLPGRGKVIEVNGVRHYVGDLPESGDVYVIGQKQLEAMVNDSMAMLPHISRDAPSILGHFPDAMQLTFPVGGVQKFYLDRCVFTASPENYFVLRYQTVSNALENGEFEDE